jgi:hypothetical protein
MVPDAADAEVLPRRWRNGARERAVVPQVRSERARSLQTGDGEVIRRATFAA